MNKKKMFVLLVFLILGQLVAYGFYKSLGWGYSFLPVLAGSIAAYWFGYHKKKA